jgi:hypothetical protein
MGLSGEYPIFIIHLILRISAFDELELGPQVNADLLCPLDTFHRRQFPRYLP